jgi:copper(I)-binding protein
MNERTTIRALAAMACLALGVAPALAGHAGVAPSTVVRAGAIEISGAFARATLPSAPVGGGFLTLTNPGTEDDRLVAVSSPAAGRVRLHEMKMEGDVMKMGELLDGVAVPAGTTVTLSPSGDHMMFTELKEPFVEGGTVPVTLTFERAGTVEVKLPVEGIAATGPEAAAGASGTDAMSVGSGQ